MISFKFNKSYFSLTCLKYAGYFYEHLLLPFCDGTNPGKYIYYLNMALLISIYLDLLIHFYNIFILIIIDLIDVWHEGHKECNRTCTMKSQNISCSDNNTAIKAVFQFDITLPVSTYNFGKCHSCFNITLIDVLCKLNVTNMKAELSSTQSVQITTSEMTSDPQLTQNVETATSEMISDPQLTQKVETATSEMISEPHLTQNVEITTAETISESHLSQNGEMTTPKMISRSSGIFFKCFV